MDSSAERSTCANRSGSRCRLQDARHLPFPNMGLRPRSEALCAATVAGDFQREGGKPGEAGCGAIGESSRLQKGIGGASSCGSLGEHRFLLHIGLNARVRMRARSGSFGRVSEEEAAVRGERLLFQRVEVMSAEFPGTNLNGLTPLLSTSPEMQFEKHGQNAGLSVQGQILGLHGLRGCFATVRTTPAGLTPFTTAANIRATQQCPLLPG